MESVLEVLSRPYSWEKGAYHTHRTIRGKDTDCYCLVGAVREVYGIRTNGYTGCDMTGADFTGARLDGVILEGVTATDTICDDDAPEALKKVTAA